jgi:hypothetical protein
VQERALSDSPITTISTAIARTISATSFQSIKGLTASFTDTSIKAASSQISSTKYNSDLTADSLTPTAATNFDVSEESL